MITLKQAVKELQTDLLETGERKSVKLRAAQRLGIQSLKRELFVRQHLKPSSIELLPGETRE